MRKLLEVGALALLLLDASPGSAVNPDRQATATARIFRPLTISSVQNLDFGTLVLSGSGAWSGQVINMDQAGVLTGCGGRVTCFGTPQPAKYHLSGTNNAIVTISVPRFNLTGPAFLAFRPNAPITVSLGAAGATTGVNFGVGGSITLNSSTPAGIYTGTMLVTADYQ